jgi:hypothetical protein
VGFELTTVSFLFRIDRTETGHVLGRAAKLGPISAPERKLNRATFSILRLLTHISMYIGANTNSGVNIIKKYPKAERKQNEGYLERFMDLRMKYEHGKKRHLAAAA